MLPLSNRSAARPRTRPTSRLGLKALVLLAAATAAASPSTASAHAGHDHGDAPATAAPTAQPRVSARSEAYELVGILDGGRLRVFLDRFETNEPVTDAEIAVTVGDAFEAVVAEPAPDGTFAVASDAFAGTGPVELVFAITAPAGDDLLIGTLPLPGRPDPAAAPPGAPSQPREGLVVAGFGVRRPYALAGSALALGFCLGLVVRGGGRATARRPLRRRLAPAAGVAAFALLAATAYAFSHEGEDHGDGAAAPAPAALPGGRDAPRRLADGSAFMPKPTQRLLDIRTAVAKPEPARKAVQLIGRVTADPNRGGVVQSLTGGRVAAPDGGLPGVGQAVRRGDLLALVERPLPPEDRVGLSEMAGEIEQLIAVAETKLRRARQLVARNVAPESQVVDAEVELGGLRRRRDIIRSTRAELEELRAPADGVIAAARIVPGQVVQSQDVLFEIVDPGGLWVEALVYGELDPASLAEAEAIGTGGRPMRLAVRGFSRTLQQGAVIVQLAILDPPEGLSVGQPVTVVARHGEPVTGLVMPRDAVVRGANGEAMVWSHRGPEGFDGRPVRTEPFDATRLLVTGGVDEGERVVVRAAELVNQVR